MSHVSLPHITDEPSILPPASSWTNAIETAPAPEPVSLNDDYAVMRARIAALEEQLAAKPVTDECTGAVIDAVFADGSVRLSLRNGAVKRYTFYRSRTEADLSAYAKDLADRLRENGLPVPEEP